MSAGRVRAGAQDCTFPVQGHPNYCIGGIAAYGISLGGTDHPLEGLYQPEQVRRFDQNTSEINIGSGTVPAGQKFRVLLDSVFFRYDPDTFQPGDVAIAWLDSTKRDHTISNLKELPVDAFLPVTS
ncbi:hypothetical protein [Actinomadura sp. HBU206391]|uniref:hypothetical protein n=1 Tax=Actinomadura sp. HBU206391 TaxID=2731692 RepID=UPI001650C3AE|nr:hypothetical protein [Actinomadura sp. HBU206391]MBC6459135.1 hypothetical protein [Actinomadura sp. HBU206391]